MCAFVTDVAREWDAWNTLRPGEARAEPGPDGTARELPRQKGAAGAEGGEGNCPGFGAHPRFCRRIRQPLEQRRSHLPAAGTGAAGPGASDQAAAGALGERTARPAAEPPVTVLLRALRAFTFQKLWLSWLYEPESQLFSPRYAFFY